MSEDVPNRLTRIASWRRSAGGPRHRSAPPPQRLPSVTLEPITRHLTGLRNKLRPNANAKRALAAVMVAALAVPLIAPLSRADDPPEPPEEIVVTKDDLDSTATVLQVVVSSTSALGYFFDLVGTTEEFDTYNYNLPLDEHTLTLRGDFPVRIAITGPSPADLPLRVKLDNVTIENPADGAAFALAEGSNTEMTLLGANVLTSSQGAGLQVPSGAKLSIADAPGATATPSLTATGGSGAGIGAQGNGSAGNVTFGGNILVYAQAGGTSVNVAGIGGGAAAGTRTLTVNGGTVVAKGSGQAPGIGGIANLAINGGFVSATSGDPLVSAVGGLTSKFQINGGNVYGDTGLAQPKNAAGSAVYPVYAAPGLAGLDVSGANWVAQTITAEQEDWDQAHGGAFPTATFSAQFWAPEGVYDELTATAVGQGVQPPTELAANVKASATPYSPGQWTNVLAPPLRIQAAADGQADQASSAEFTLTLSQPVSDLTITNLTLTNGTGRAVLGDLITSTDGGATWTVPLASVSRQGEVTLTITPPATSAVDYAVLPMPLTFEVYKNLGLISGGASQRYGSPMAALTFTGGVSGTYYFLVSDAAAPPPASPQDLADNATGQGTLLDGPNNLVVKGAAQGMDNAAAKTVYFTGYPTDSEQLTNVFAIDVPAAGDELTLTNSNTAAGTISITVTSADTYRINSGLVNTSAAVLGSVDGWWAQLNGVDGLRFDSDPILASGLTGVRALSIGGGGITASAPLKLTLRNVALAPTTNTVPGIATGSRANVELNVDGTNTIVGGPGAANTTAGSPGISVPQANGGNSGQVRVTSVTGGKLTVTGGRFAAGIGGGQSTGGGLITIDGDVSLTATGGAGYSTSATYQGGAAIGGGASGAMGQITIGGQAQVYAATSSITPYHAAAIGAGHYGSTGNYLGAANNWVHIQDQATVVAASRYANASYAAPAIGVWNSASSFGSVRIDGGLVVACSGISTVAAIGAATLNTSNPGSTVITGGSVATYNSTAGTRGILSPVDGQGQALYPVYVPAASADGVDLTDKDIDFGVDYRLHTLTADQRAWTVASGNYYPAPAAVPLTDPSAVANNTAYVAGQAWLPEGIYTTIQAGIAPEYDNAKLLAADVSASAPA
ncbi:MAG: hypothetical protein LBG11_09070, partial [Bifidobacteriaceae bacterium]|nr:hypothetical protein [Bifidobacteriaceae bacterium]